MPHNVKYADYGTLHTLSGNHILNIQDWINLNLPLVHFRYSL